MDQQSLMSRQLDFIDKDDPYFHVKQDFSNQFYKHNLDSLTNPTDLGFLDIGKNYIDSFSNHLEDHTSLLEPETTHGMRMGGQLDDLDSYQNALRTSTYSPMGLSHPAGGHFSAGMNANFAFNGMKQQQSYQQEHQRYGGYHSQNYYYPNHYDAHMMQSNHDNGVDYYPSHDMDNHNDDPLSYMWSDESARAMKMKMNGGYHGENNKVKPGYSGYDHDHHDDYNHDRIVKMQEMSRLPVRKGLEPQLKGMNPLSIDPSRIEVKDPAMKGMNGSMKFGARLSPKRAPAGKPDLFDDEDDDGDDGYGEGKGRSTRGLRVLSLKVKEIVSQKKRTSYKEVAETLTYELRQKMTSRSTKEESKDEQNVKRRVYDALNVLIAADVLRKEGKIVYCDDAAGAHGFSGRKRGSENRDKILADIQEARKRNKAKIEQLHELIFKCLAIKNLIKTNKEKTEAEQKNPKKIQGNVNATRIEVVQENPALKPKNEDVIRFPFIVLLSSSPENSMNLNMDTMQRQLAIESKKPFNIFGDIDVLLKMGLHYVTRQMFDENIPTELQRYVPKYYLAALK